MQPHIADNNDDFGENESPRFFAVVIVTPVATMSMTLPPS